MKGKRHGKYWNRLRDRLPFLKPRCNFGWGVPGRSCGRECPFRFRYSERWFYSCGRHYDVDEEWAEVESVGGEE